jgi:NAD(P)-dependent dehydrogenase (short-subunit alcohol dehydrogenase family)
MCVKPCYPPRCSNRLLLLDHHPNPNSAIPRDVVSAAAFLASDESRFVNGALIPVDGGFTVHQPTILGFRRLFAASRSNRL